MAETICPACHSAVHHTINTHWYHQSSIQCRSSWSVCSETWSVTTPTQQWTICVNLGDVRAPVIFVLYKILFEYLFSALHHSSVQYRLVIMFPLSIWELLICDNAVLFYPPRLLISDLHTVSRIFTLSDSSNWSPNTHHRVGHYLHNGILMPTHTGSVGWREGREKFI